MPFDSFACQAKINVSTIVYESTKQSETRAHRSLALLLVTCLARGGFWKEEMVGEQKGRFLSSFSPIPSPISKPLLRNVFLEALLGFVLVRKKKRLTNHLDNSAADWLPDILPEPFNDLKKT